MSGGSRPEAGDPAALDAILAALGDWLHEAAPAAREELRSCLRRVITWPWPQDMHAAVMFCRIALQNQSATGGNR